MMPGEYDVVVIGAGPGGYVAAIRAAQLGLKTAIFERESLGGVCLNWGCIPSKALLKNAEVVSYFYRAEEFGLKFENFTADYTAAIERSRKVVDRNVRGVTYLLRKNEVEHIAGEATLRGNGVVEVSPEGQRIEAKNIIIATGARPRSIPSLPIDGKDVITSREAILLADLPKSLVIVGGGAIGLEFAYLYRMYGVEVTVVELLPRLAPNEDEEISRQVERSFNRHRINIITGASVNGMERKPDGLQLTITRGETEETLQCEKVLVATGISPNSENLGLDGVGVATEGGYIVVDENMATNVPGIHAIGDVTGRLALAHVASAQAMVAAEAIAGLEPLPLDYTMMPRATYCQPQIASFGLTESQAVEAGHEIRVGRFNLQANGKAMGMGETDGMIKLVVDSRFGEILGAHLVGAEVTELLGELSLARLLEGTTMELGWMVHAHPTISEIIKEAALDAEGRVLHM